MPSFLQAGQGAPRAEPARGHSRIFVYSYHSRLVVTPGEVQTTGAGST